jgi:hypothetical protein
MDTWYGLSLDRLVPLGLRLVADGAQQRHRRRIFVLPQVAVDQPLLGLLVIRRQPHRQRQILLRVGEPVGQQRNISALPHRVRVVRILLQDLLITAGGLVEPAGLQQRIRVGTLRGRAYRGMQQRRHRGRTCGQADPRDTPPPVELHHRHTPFRESVSVAPPVLPPGAYSRHIENRIRAGNNTRP